MDVAVTGKKGSGKSLYCVKLGKDMFARGLRVAFNFPVKFGDFKISPRGATNHAIVLPDVPTRADFDSLGYGCDLKHIYDEDKYGAIFLDECSRIFNSRDWNNRDRQPVLDWLIHARKLGWRVFYLTQHVNQLDKQLRESLIELHVICRRSDKVNIPFLPFKLPKAHMALTFYGVNNGSNHPPSAGRALYHPALLGKYYDSNYLFTDRQGAYCTIPYQLGVMRYKKPREKFSFSFRYLANFLIFPIALIVYLCFRSSIKAAKHA